MKDILPFFPILYAEMHYTLRGFSLIHRDWPEIIADAPTHVEPGMDIPILLLVKDAHRYPTVLDHVHTVVRYPDGDEYTQSLLEKSAVLEQPWWTKLCVLKPERGFSGPLTIDVVFHAHRNNNETMRVFHNDNYSGTSHRPLRVAVGKTPYPRFDDWKLGDLHVHSSLTSGQTEFGAPLDATAVMARAAGLNFIAVTDHSYDLDDCEDDYLQNAAHLPKWKQLHKSIRHIASETGLVLIPGEEATCRNRLGQNVHMLLLNNQHFVPGSGDGAERWFQTRSERSIREILDTLEDDALAFAAHPEVPFPPLHWLFLNRWKWTLRDYRHPNLSGLEILNGGEYFFYRRGLKKWIRLLLEGQRVSIIAGNDAHGNFNRFRQLGLPFLSFREHDEHVFGKDRTAVLLKGTPTKDAILAALKQGRSAITNGPALRMELFNEAGEKARIGDTLSGSQFRILIEGRSSEEFGNFASCTIWSGVIGERRECLVEEVKTFEDPYAFSSTHTTEGRRRQAYIRAEVATKKNGQTFFCLTNPIWINTSSS